MATYRETVNLYEPPAGATTDGHGHASDAPTIVGKSAARIVTDDRQTQSTGPGEAITGGVELELRTNLAIEVGWTLRWRSRNYIVRSVAAGEPLKQRVTITPAV